jgi:hypothetical protein
MSAQQGTRYERQDNAKERSVNPALARNAPERPLRVTLSVN